MRPKPATEINGTRASIQRHPCARESITSVRNVDSSNFAKAPGLQSCQILSATEQRPLNGIHRCAQHHHRHHHHHHYRRLTKASPWSIEIRADPLLPYPPTSNYSVHFHAAMTQPFLFRRRYRLNYSHHLGLGCRTSVEQISNCAEKLTRVDWKLTRVD